MQQYDLAQARLGRVRTRIIVVTAVVWLVAGVGERRGLLAAHVAGVMSVPAAAASRRRVTIHAMTIETL